MLLVVRCTALRQVARAGIAARRAVSAGALATGPLWASGAAGMPGPRAAHERALLHADGTSPYCPSAPTGVPTLQEAGCKRDRHCLGRSRRMGVHQRCQTRVIAAACSMAELMEVATNPGGPAAAVTAVMASNPTCGACLMSCASASDATSCAMGCASQPVSTAAATAAAAVSTCTVEELTSGLIAVDLGGTSGALSVLKELMATNPLCGMCMARCAAEVAKGGDEGMKCAIACASGEARGGVGDTPTWPASSGAAVSLTLPVGSRPPPSGFCGR